MSLDIIAQLTPYPGSMALMYYDASGNGINGNLYFVNTGTISDSVRIALTPVNQTPEAASYILYDAPLAQGHTVLLQNIYLGNQERLYVYSFTGYTNYVLSGFEY